MSDLLITIFAYVVMALPVVAFLWLLYLIKIAPYGYEDENGFHYGYKDKKGIHHDIK
jgi:hypothetical protein